MDASRPPAMRGIVLFAHGSRDALWRAPIEAVRADIERQRPDLLVRCAYLELCAPDLASACSELHAAGARALTIVPMFLGTGRHAREDLPLLVEQVRARHPDVALTVQPSIGEDPRMMALMAQIAAADPTTAR